MIESPNLITKSILYHDYAKEQLKNDFREDKWVILYKKENNIIDEKLNITFDLWQWCYIVYPEMINEIKDNYEADLNFDERSALYSDNNFITYKKFGFESLVTIMNFYDFTIRKQQIRIHEDLIHLFHLYEKIINQETREYIEYKENYEKVIIKIEKNKVKILHQYLHDFLCAKQMDLVCVVRSELNMPPDSTSAIKCSYKYTGHKGINIKDFNLGTCNFSIAVTGGIEFQSWFIGKKIILHKESGTYKSAFDYEYADFIIGYDKNTCADIVCKCDNEENKYVRVFFKREVLEKYRNNTDVSIEPYNIYWLNHFSLKCNNNHPDYIWCRLNSLRCLPYSEQIYWKSYNFPPVDSLAKENIWDCPSNWKDFGNLPEYQLRERFKLLNKKWKNKFGWELFIQDKDLQAKFLNHIFSLGNDCWTSFSNFLQNLNRVLTESLNASKLNQLGYKFEGNKKSIMKLSQVLEHKGIIKSEFINFLLQLNTLRNEFSDSHLLSENPSKNLMKALNYVEFSFEKKNFQEASINLIKKGLNAFKTITQQIDHIENLFFEGDPND